MSDDRKNAGFLVDKDALEQAKENCEHGELSEELRQTVHRLAYGAETTRREQLKEELETHRSNIREIRTDIQNSEGELAEERRKAARVEEQLDELRDMDDHYDGMLDAIESDLRDGKRVFKGQPKVEKAAEAGGKSPDAVIRDLKKRNEDLPAEAFRPAGEGEPARWKSGKSSASLASLE